MKNSTVSSLSITALFTDFPRNISNGLLNKDILKELKTFPRTVSAVVQRFRERGANAALSRSGRPLSENFSEAQKPITFRVCRNPRRSMRKENDNSLFKSLAVRTVVVGRQQFLLSRHFLRFLQSFHQVADRTAVEK